MDKTHPVHIEVDLSYEEIAEVGKALAIQQVALNRRLVAAIEAGDTQVSTRTQYRQYLLDGIWKKLDAAL